MEIDDIVTNKSAGYRRPSPQSHPIPAPCGLPTKKPGNILRCIFKHIIFREGQYICYTCGQIDNNKPSNMKHLKTAHGGVPVKGLKKTGVDSAVKIASIVTS